MNDQTKMGYEPSLDGIRAFSVIAVMLYHANVAFPTSFLFCRMHFRVGISIHPQSPMQTLHFGVHGLRDS